MLESVSWRVISRNGNQMDHRYTCSSLQLERLKLHWCFLRLCKHCWERKWVVVLGTEVVGEIFHHSAKEWKIISIFFLMVGFYSLVFLMEGLWLVSTIITSDSGDCLRDTKSETEEGLNVSPCNWCHQQVCQHSNLAFFVPVQREEDEETQIKPSCLNGEKKYCIFYLCKTARTT